MPYSMPHVPIYASEKFNGSTGKGLFTDVIAEIDWSVGEVLQTLKRHGLSEKTLVVFTSDNGPWLSYGNHAGSAAPLREGKGTTWEGGQREPTIVSWPGQIEPDSVSGAVAGTIDILPTLAYLAGAELPQQRIDGQNIWPILAGPPTTPSPHEAYFYYWGRELQAVRSGPWKLHFPHAYRSLDGEPGKDGKPGPYINRTCGLELYHLDDDIGETKNVADQHPEVVTRLQSLAEKMRDDLGDELTKKQGSGLRPAGKLE
jgi:arylsulfatase A